jgi:4-hydroxybutyrate dehydrogenase
MTLLLDIPKVHFGFDAINVLPDELNELGIRRPLMVTDQGLVKCGIFRKVRETFPQNSSLPVFDQMPENPTVEEVEKAYEIYRQEHCDGVVAVGGGSVIDGSKAVALLAGHPGPLSQYDRHSEKITAATAPIVAIPTTAGTGSEVTNGAGIHPDLSSPSMNIGSPYLRPRLAICDPNLTMSLPPVLTAGTGMDALSQCIEGYLAKPVNPPIDAVALDGIQRVVNYIERAVKDGSDKEARWHMMMAGLQGGISIGKGLGSGHAIANTLGDKGFHHGVLVTVVLPSVLRFLESHVGDKMTEVAKALGLHNGNEVAGAIDRLNERLALPKNLRELGYPLDDLDQIAEICKVSFFVLGSARVPTHEEYKMIITDSMG